MAIGYLFESLRPTPETQFYDPLFEMLSMEENSLLNPKEYNGCTRLIGPMVASYATA